MKKATKLLMSGLRQHATRASSASHRKKTAEMYKKFRKMDREHPKGKWTKTNKRLKEFGIRGPISVS